MYVLRVIKIVDNLNKIMKYIAMLLLLFTTFVMVDCPVMKAEKQHCAYCEGSCLECITGYYGVNCDKKCFQCPEGQQCDRQSGKCTEEIKSYSISNWSYNCSKCEGICKICISGWHGEMCTLKCTNCTQDGCNKTTGICKNCKHNFYGPNCDKPCPPHCHTAVDETSCHRENGFCLDGCQHGHYGQTCNLTCSSGCMNQTCSCDGTCFDGCKEGFSGKCCNICNVSFYGPKCDEPCAPGCVNHTCSRNGSCECLAGYTGVNCDIKNAAHIPLSKILYSLVLIVFCILGILMCCIIKRTTCLRKYIENWRKKKERLQYRLCGYRSNRNYRNGDPEIEV